MSWDISNYNPNPSLNTAINGIDIAELSAAAGYNDALRQIMADIAAWVATQAIALPLSIANGGTGQTAAPAALAALGGLGAAYQRLPQTAETTAFSFSLAMDGGHVRYTGGANLATIDPEATTNFPIGAVIVVVNDGSGVLTLKRGTGVALVWTANGLDDDRLLAIRGMATLVKVASNRWFVSGGGLS